MGPNPTPEIEDRTESEKRVPPRGVGGEGLLCVRLSLSDRSRKAGTGSPDTTPTSFPSLSGSFPTRVERTETPSGTSVASGSTTTVLAYPDCWVYITHERDVVVVCSRNVGIGGAQE